ncbi:MAG: nucleoside/nucleotide kinase family protein, partial [Falsihalocynthiibacter arcticus]
MRDLDAICTTLLAAPRKGRRRLVALAGAPASGKSTLAQDLADRMTAAGCDTRVLPMDGFHLGNTQLHAQGNFAQKGAPQTFDVRGFLMLVARIQTEDEVFYPIFDRTLDAAIAAEGRVDKACDTVIVEGNYLLF